MNLIITALGKLPVILLIILSAASVTAGDFFAKYWSINTRSVFYVLAIMGYVGSSIFYIPTLLREGLIITSVLWSLLSIIGFLVVGILIFKETLTNLEIIGVMLGIASLVILSLGK